MKITAIPDPEDTVLDPVDPLGLMYFQDDDGRELSVGSTSFDEWYKALIAGLKAIRAGSNAVRTEMDSVRDPVVWSSDSGGFAFTFRAHTIRIRDLDGFEKELRRSALEITDQYRNHPNWPKWCSDFQAIRAWAEER